MSNVDLANVREIHVISLRLTGIVPSETRARIVAALEMLKSKRAGAISKKHDNMSL